MNQFGIEEGAVESFQLDGLGAPPEEKKKINPAYGIGAVALIVLGAYMLFGGGSRRALVTYDVLKDRAITAWRRRRGLGRYSGFSRDRKRLRSKFQRGLKAAAARFGQRRVRTAQQTWDDIEREEEEGRS